MNSRLRLRVPWRIANIMFAAMLVLSSPTPAMAVATNANCDLFQGAISYGDNTWRQRVATTGARGPWITQIQGYINGYNYSLCHYNPVVPPWKSGSGAWLAFYPFNSGGNSIVQIRFWKCGYGPSCSPLLGNMVPGRLQWFYAWGIDNDLTKLPFPHPLAAGPAPNYNTKFKMKLVFGSPGHYEFYVNDQCLKCNLTNEWQNWNTAEAVTAVENWNQGDQLGGRTANGSDPGNKQKFLTISWFDQFITHNGGFGAVQAAGHCFPWASSTVYNSSDWYVWTEYSHEGHSC